LVVAVRNELWSSEWYPRLRLQKDLAWQLLPLERKVGFVPEVEGVGDECGLLAEVELVELVSVVVAGDGAGAGGAAGGAALTNV